MEWKKSNITGAELEQKQQAYIKEALEMAKRSTAKAEDETAVRAQEKAKVEKKAAEKAEAERKAAEKAAAEKQAAKEKAESERKAAEEKAAAEKKAAEEAAAEKKAEKEAAAEKETEEEMEDDNAESNELINPDDFAELIGAENTEDGSEDFEKNGESKDEKQEECNESDSELIDTAQLAKTKSSEKAKKENAPTNFNQYVNQHNKAQCNCPNCRRKRAMMQQ